MDQHEEDRATITAVLERFEQWRLPQALEIKSRLEGGETLTERDNEFLGRVFESMRELMPIVERNPEYQKLAAHAIGFLDELTKLAEENEAKLEHDD